MGKIQSLHFNIGAALFDIILLDTFDPKPLQQ